jgi:predicted alpha-1,2-mannosidase
MRARAASYLCRFSLLCVFLSAAATAQSVPSPYESVDPMIGTDGGGNTFPGATVPFGMVQWSPDTNRDAWYVHSEKKIYGFSLTHISGAGCPLYGDFAVLPVADELTSSPWADFGPYAVGFDHQGEQSHPGYYSVVLANGVTVELTTTERAGIARFHFPQGVSARLLVNAGSSANTGPGTGPDLPMTRPYGSSIELQGGDSFAGSVAAGGFCGSESFYKVYVDGQFSKPYRSTTVWQDDSVLSGQRSADGKHTGAWLDFGDEREVTLKVGISFVGERGAHTNLAREIPGWDFERMRERSREIWGDLLNRVTVQGGTLEQRTIFYTGLYHSFLSPNIFSDDDGKYVGFDHQIHTLAAASQHAQYANFSDWDIYRNTVQLQALFDPQRESDMMQSLVNDAVQSGWYPRWPAANDVTYVMGGDSPVILVSSSYAFGARSFDLATALKYMLKAGSEPGVGPHHQSERPFLSDYLKLGYVTIDEDSIAASRTLEYASADFAIAQFAHNLGRDVEYGTFLRRSANWKKLLDPETHWIRPRAGDGTWLAGFDPERSLPKRKFAPVETDQNGFEEGNTYQYSFMIPFDYPALFAAMGGESVVVARLDKFFSKLRCWGEPCFNMENEPDFVTPYAYLFAGQPWKTQELIPRIENETFKTTPDGLPGNDDLGATSGVYVWNALGLYPAVPGVGGLVLGSPMFDRATVRLSADRTLVISRQGRGGYVQGVTLDGAVQPSTWLPVDRLHAGTTELRFSMGTQPNKGWGSALPDRPPLFR